MKDFEVLSVGTIICKLYWHSERIWCVSAVIVYEAAASRSVSETGDIVQSCKVMLPAWGAPPVNTKKKMGSVFLYVNCPAMPTRWASEGSKFISISSLSETRQEEVCSSHHLRLGGDVVVPYNSNIYSLNRFRWWLSVEIRCQTQLLVDVRSQCRPEQGNIYARYLLLPWAL